MMIGLLQSGTGNRERYLPSEAGERVGGGVHDTARLRVRRANRVLGGRQHRPCTWSDACKQRIGVS